MDQTQRLAALAVFVFLVGCFERQLRPVNPCTTSEVEQTIAIEQVDTLDLLFVVDDSGSMSQEQALLRREIPRMIAILASGNTDADPAPEFTAVRSMHVGVVSVNMGGDARTGTGVVSACAGIGDDGVMNNISRADNTVGLTPCEAVTYPSRIFDFERGSDASAFGDEIGCVANLGTSGCGFEQQLEAGLKALSPADPTDFVSSTYVPPPFHTGTGHGGPGGANADFLRRGSALAIVLLTDEDDCSADDLRLFDATATEYGPGTSRDLGLRCSQRSDALYAVSRYVDGFSQLRSNPNLLVFAAITGIPLGTPAEATYTEILDAELMQIYDDPAESDSTPLRPSCRAVDPANGVAYPARRIVEVARGLEAVGASTTVQSICADTFGPAVDVIVDRIADALSGACLPRALNQNADGTVACNVFELLPATGDGATTCAMADLELVDVEENAVTGVMRELCRVPQITPSAGAAGSARGWYYDNTSMEVMGRCPADAAQRIAFSMLMPPTGSDVRLNCTQAILPSTGTEVQLGTFCSPFAPAGAENPCSSGGVPSMNPGQSLSCDPVVRTCGVACTSSADCTSAGLLSYICDNRTVLDAVGGDMSRVPDVDGSGGDGDATDAVLIHGYCVNPTC